MDELEKIYSSATGHLNLIQEQRFRLIVDDGRSFLLTLGNKAPIDVRDLAEFKQNSAHVRVVFSGAPNQASCVAYAVRKLDE